MQVLCRALAAALLVLCTMYVTACGGGGGDAQTIKITSSAGTHVVKCEGTLTGSSGGLEVSAYNGSTGTWENPNKIVVTQWDNSGQNPKKLDATTSVTHSGQIEFPIHEAATHLYITTSCGGGDTCVMTVFVDVP